MKDMIYVLEITAWAVNKSRQRELTVKNYSFIFMFSSVYYFSSVSFICYDTKNYSIGTNGSKEDKCLLQEAQIQVT